MRKFQEGLARLAVRSKHSAPPLAPDPPGDQVVSHQLVEAICWCCVLVLLVLLLCLASAGAVTNLTENGFGEFPQKPKNPLSESQLGTTVRVPPCLCLLQSASHAWAPVTTLRSWGLRVRACCNQRATLGRPRLLRTLSTSAWAYHRCGMGPSMYVLAAISEPGMDR